MPTQFLLNFDGSMPDGAPEPEVFERLGIPLVWPTDPPEKPGHVAVEVEPQEDKKGVLRQAWVLELVPEPEPEPEATPSEALVDVIERMPDDLREALRRALAPAP